MELALNREKTKATSFEDGFRFLGAIFVKEAIYLPFDRPQEERLPLHFPAILDLLTYVELRPAPLISTSR